MSADLKVNLIAAAGALAFLCGVYELAGAGPLLLVLGGSALAYSWFSSRSTPTGKG